MKTFKDYILSEEGSSGGPVNTSSGGGINMNPTGRPRRQKYDNRSRFAVNKMYKRALGLSKVRSPNDR